MDKTGKMILDLVPEEKIKKIPFFIRNHATGKTIEKIANEHPDLYKQAQECETLEGDLKEQLSQIINDIFDLKMKKHGYQ